MTNPSKNLLRNVVSDGKRVGRPKNAEVRTREHLTPAEVDRLANAAKERGRYGSRDALAIRMAARHGFRVSELCQIDLRAGLIHVTRKKNGVPSTNPLNGDEIRGLRASLPCLSMSKPPPAWMPSRPPPPSVHARRLRGGSVFRRCSTWRRIVSVSQRARAPLPVRLR